MSGIFRGDDQSLQPLRCAAAHEFDCGTTPTSGDIRCRSAVEAQGDVPLMSGDFACLPI
jgi:hypothetical protein